MTTAFHDDHDLGHVSAELEGLRRSLPALVEKWALTALLVVRIGNAWASFKMLEREIEAVPEGTPIDQNGRLDADFLRFAESVSALVRRLDRLGFRNVRTRLVRLMLVRLHDRIERLRIRIREHDADCSPMIHGPYDNADDLIAALDAKDR